jgi:hypothetical protein
LSTIAFAATTSERNAKQHQPEREQQDRVQAVVLAYQSGLLNSDGEDEYV